MLFALCQQNYPSVKCNRYVLQPNHGLLFFSVVVNCGAPPALPNGQNHGSDYSYNATVTYSCNAANFKLSGSQERTCQADGQWSGVQPACLGKFYFNSTPLL